MEIGSLSISLGAAIALLRQSRWEAAHEIRRGEFLREAKRPFAKNSRRLGRSA
jgi:hypothetical protein